MMKHDKQMIKNVKKNEKNDKTMKKTRGKLQFSIFCIFFCATGRKMMKNDN